MQYEAKFPPKKDKFKIYFKMQYEAKFFPKKDKFKMLNQVNLRLNATERISYHQVTPGSIFLKGGREGVKTKGSGERSGADRKFPLLDAYPALYTTFLAENTQIVFILRLMN